MSDTPSREFDSTFEPDETVKNLDASDVAEPASDVTADADVTESDAAEPHSIEAGAEQDAGEGLKESPEADAPAVDAPVVVGGAEGSEADASDAEAEPEGDADAEVSPVADDGNVVSTETDSGPLALASSVAPASQADATAQDSSEAAPAGDAGEAHVESATDGAADTDSDAAGKSEPVPATPAPLDAIRAGGQSQDGEPDASAGIVPQPKPEDALAARPLSGIASDEARGAVDAMPAAAQQHMGSWVKGVYEAEPAEPGQLPTTADLPGTPMDATGVGTYSDRGITKADEGIEARADAGDESAQEAVDAATGEGEADGEAKSDEGFDADAGTDGSLDEGDDEDSDGDEGLGLGKGDEGADEGAEDDCEASDEGYFGEPKMQHGPLVDVAGDAVDAFKSAAEQAALAQNHFQNVPFGVLDMEHKDLISDLRVVLGDVLRLAARFFERSGS